MQFKLQEKPAAMADPNCDQSLQRTSAIPTRSTLSIAVIAMEIKLDTLDQAPKAVKTRVAISVFC